jgi:hypothetical protein
VVPWAVDDPGATPGTVQRDNARSEGCEMSGRSSRRTST